MKQSALSRQVGSLTESRHIKNGVNPSFSNAAYFDFLMLSAYYSVCCLSKILHLFDHTVGGLFLMWKGAHQREYDSIPEVR